MRIYVASLSDYNNGHLHGRWIEAVSDVETMQAQVSDMLRKSRFPNVMRRVYGCQDCGETHTVQDLAWSKGSPECEHCGKALEPQGAAYPSAEEFAIHDHEGLGGLGEYAGLGEVARRVEIAELADERDIPLSVILEFANDHLPKGADLDDIESAIDESYRGSYDSWKDFAEELTRETSDMSAVPAWLEYHIDWESIGRDFELSGDFNGYGLDGSIYFFWAH